jgi:DNA-binding beta-propeller fold protein YncE
VAVSPETHKLFVASAKGKVYIYDAGSYELISTVDFEGGADNLRYDAANKRVYVGCGDDEKNAAIATIDATTNQRLDEEYKLGGEPESFQLETSGHNIYVNIPDLKQIAVINRNTKEITRWPLLDEHMSFDPAVASQTTNRICQSGVSIAYARVITTHVSDRDPCACGALAALSRNQNPRNRKMMENGKRSSALG